MLDQLALDMGVARQVLDREEDVLERDTAIVTVVRYAAVTPSIGDRRLPKKRVTRVCVCLRGYLHEVELESISVSTFLMRNRCSDVSTSQSLDIRTHLKIQLLFPVIL